MQRYEHYKPSGVAWLGKIPSHWNVRRNKGVFDERKEADQPDMELLSVTINRGVIKQDEITAKKDSSNEDKSKYKVVRQNDLAYNKMRMWQGAIGASDRDGIVSPAYIVLRPRDALYSRYYHYLYRTEAFIAEANRHSYGLCLDMNSLRYEDFKSIYSPVPPREDVVRIVAFLDQKTTEIDAAIAKKKRLIELLQEQKSILINQAVTRGLNPDVPMRDSGVEWIGRVPNHWPTMRFKRCFSLIKDGLHHTPKKHDKGVNFVSTQHVRNRQIDIENATKISQKDYWLGHPRVRPEAGDVLITLVGSIGFAAIVKNEHLPLSCTRHVGYVRPLEKKINRDFLLHYTESPAFGSFIDKNVSKTAQPSIYLSSISNHEIALPPLIEQQQIVAWLDQQIELYQRISASANEQISHLEGMKVALIDDVVTGKVQI
jgi:type I restriction enzyme S subunit